MTWTPAPHGTCPECTHDLDPEGDCFECGTGKFARFCECGLGDWLCSNRGNCGGRGVRVEVTEATT